MTFDIGEEKSRRAGAPAWESVWPVLIDGKEVAEIVETERGYRLRKGGTWGPERAFRGTVEEEAFTRFTGRPAEERHTAHEKESEA